MATSVYLFLPHTDDAILSVADADNMARLYERVTVLARMIRGQGKKLYYDAENIRNFIAKCCSLSGSDRYTSNMRKAISRTAIDVSYDSYKEKASVYVQWNYDLHTINTQPPQLLIEVMERMLAYPQETCVVVNFNNSIPACREYFLLFKDAKHNKDYPSAFTKIPFVSDKDELELWLKTHHVTTFSLLDKERFRRTNKIVQGALVYQEVQTKRYWYMDMFHKDEVEYEVFDARGNHIGVANSAGEIDPNGKVPSRIIDI